MSQGRKSPRSGWLAGWRSEELDSVCASDRWLQATEAPRQEVPQDLRDSISARHWHTRR